MAPFKKLIGSSLLYSDRIICNFVFSDFLQSKYGEFVHCQPSHETCRICHISSQIVILSIKAVISYQRDYYSLYCSWDVIPPTHLLVLSNLVTGMPDDVTWVVSGSTALALQDIPVQPRDIDLMSDKEGVYIIEGYFSEYVDNPVKFSKTETIASHFGSLMIGGIKVELMGDIQHRKADGSWTQPSDLTDKQKIISVDNIAVPVFQLQYEYEGYKLMGRHDRAALIRDYLR